MASQQEHSENLRRAREAFQKLVASLTPDQRQFLTGLREWAEAWYADVGMRGLWHIFLGR